MPLPNSWLKWIIVLGGCFLIGFMLLVGVGGKGAQISMMAQNSDCSALPPVATTDAATPSASAPTSPSPTAPLVRGTSTATATPDEAENNCYPASRYGGQVVAWAKAMANALYVNPACGVKRGGACNDVYYTSAFPHAVIQYGQAWCAVHGECSDWASGSYQCVSFVRGAYSQVYPMPFSNNAFDLWATYQNLPGWQEIPSLATPDPLKRFLPEPGDVMVFKDHSLGHVAIVLQVQPPVDGRNGWITFANANSSSAYDRMPLLPSLIVDTSEWTSDTFLVWGYIRPKTNASESLVRISQLDPGQYASQSEFETWAYSACSAAAMTEVLNAYGLHLHIHDVLQVESTLIMPGSSPPTAYITPQLGLMQDAGISATMQHFGFHTTWGEHWTLDQVLAAANSGTPVIVSWPPDRYAGGHIVVVTGGNSHTITLADSSSWDRQTISVAQFLTWWAGFAAVATPLA